MNVEPVIVIEPPLRLTAPPPAPVVAVLFENMQLVIMVDAALLEIAAPPAPLTEPPVLMLFVNEQFVTVSATAPPTMAPPLLFVLASKTQSVTVKLPLFEIAPLTARVSVTPLSVAVSPELTENIRSVSPPLMVSKFAPGLVMVSGRLSAELNA